MSSNHVSSSAGLPSKPKDRDSSSSVKFSLALNSTKYIPSESNSVTSPTHIPISNRLKSCSKASDVTGDIYGGGLGVNNSENRSEDVRQLVCNSRVLYEVNTISSSILEFKVVKIATNSLSTLGVSSSTKDISGVQAGLDKYDMRALYVMMTISFGIFCFLLIVLRNKVSIVSIVISACLPVMVYCLFVLPSIVIEESVIIIQNLGFKVQKKYLFGHVVVKFVELDKLESVFLHEYIFRSEVKFCLAMILEGEDKLLLVFHDIYPGFKALRNIYRSCYKELQ